MKLYEITALGKQTKVTAASVHVAAARGLSNILRKHKGGEPKHPFTVEIRRIGSVTYLYQLEECYWIGEPNKPGSYTSWRLIPDSPIYRSSKEAEEAAREYAEKHSVIAPIHTKCIGSEIA